MILDYNKSKGGVDACDQMMATFSCKRAVWRRPIALFSYILDISGINAFLIYTNIMASSWSNLCMREILKNVASELVKPHIIRREKM